MLLAFLFPLLGGALPCALLMRTPRCAQPGVLSRCLYDSGLAALTVGSIFRGVLEIYGTTSRLSAVYWICWITLCALGLAVYGFCRMVTLPRDRGISG